MLYCVEEMSFCMRESWIFSINLEVEPMSSNSRWYNCSLASLMNLEQISYCTSRASDSWPFTGSPLGRILELERPCTPNMAINEYNTVLAGHPHIPTQV
jgi:hypothetical protein